MDIGSHQEEEVDAGFSLHISLECSKRKKKEFVMNFWEKFKELKIKEHPPKVIDTL